MRNFTLLCMIITLTLLSNTIKSQNKTYYGYQQRGSESYVNYAEVGSKLNESLQNARANYLQKLKDDGWASEEEYLEFKRYTKRQNKLKRKYIRGNKKIRLKYDAKGEPYYYEVN